MNITFNNTFLYHSTHRRNSMKTDPTMKIDKEIDKKYKVIIFVVEIICSMNI